MDLAGIICGLTESQGDNMYQPTIKDMIKFILAHRKDKSFIDLSIGQIAYILLEGIKNNTLYYATLNSQITGMILATIDKEKKVLFVIENISMSIANMKRFFQAAILDHPNYTYESMRHGRHIKYNSNFLNRNFLQ